MDDELGHHVGQCELKPWRAPQVPVVSLCK